MSTSPKDLPDRVGVEVKVARVRAKMTQRELARKSGISETYISEIESGKRNLTVTVIGKLADALGVSRAALLGES